MRAFDAVARHGSVARACRDLNVTPAAVSHQIKALEDWLGVRLFARDRRQIRLTELGRLYYDRVRPCFEGFAAATEEVRRSQERRTLSVAAPSSLASKWLLPRLQAFRTLHPRIDIELTVAPCREPPPREADLHIRYGRRGAAPPPGRLTWPLLRVEVFPVCAPHMAADLGGSPEALLRVPLLHDEPLQLHDDVSWPSWFEAAGVRATEIRTAMRFNQSMLACEAAAAGHGVVLAKRPHVEMDLRSGRVVRPVPVSLRAPCHYFVEVEEHQSDNVQVAAFRTWLVEEAEAEQPGLEWINAPAPIASSGVPA
ncbi:MAG TPA: LysR substrate-binding domain-containing protein [Roseomonas sp.]|jgi:LysR family glycine cleavage system transcriptional activator